MQYQRGCIGFCLIRTRVACHDTHKGASKTAQYFFHTPNCAWFVWSHHHTNRLNTASFVSEVPLRLLAQSRLLTQSKFAPLCKPVGWKQVALLISCRKQHQGPGWAAGPGKAAARRAEPSRRDEHGPRQQSPPSLHTPGPPAPARPAQPFLTVTPHNCVPRRSGETLSPAAALSSGKTGRAKRTNPLHHEAAGGQNGAHRPEEKAQPISSAARATQRGKKAGAVEGPRHSPHRCPPHLPQHRRPQPSRDNDWGTHPFIQMPLPGRGCEIMHAGLQDSHLVGS